MNKRWIYLAAIAVALFLLPGLSFGQTVIDFQNVAAPTPTGYPTPLQLNGMSFRFIGYGDLQWIEDDGTGNHVMVDGGWDGQGWFDPYGAENIITATNGKPFLFHSIDYGDLGNGYGGWTMSLLIVLADGNYAYRELTPMGPGYQITAQQLEISNKPVKYIDINIVSMYPSNYYYDNLKVTLPNIYISDVDCGVGDRLATAQLSIQQLILQKAKTATSHDDFQMFVSELVNSLRKTNIINKDEATKIKTCSAKSTVGY